MRTLRLTTFMLAVGLLALAPRPTTAAERQDGSSGGTLRLGISSTLFQGMPESLIFAVMKPFESLLIEQTGLNGELLPCGNGSGVAQGLIDGKLDVGVLEGIEFAWERQKHPELKAMMITVNQERSLKALVVVRKDCPAKCAADLKGKPVGLFRNSREHCRLFLKHLCQGGQKPDKFFAEVRQAENVEGILDDVVDNAVAAAVVDNLCLECFRRRKPARFNQLKVLEVSPAFPASVVVYREGTLDEATKQKFQHGMLRANRSLLGKQMLNLWKLTAFELVPDDYDQIVTNIARIYPSPKTARAAVKAD